MKRYEQRLITENLKLARHLARKFESDSYDAIPEAYFALTIAATRYQDDSLAKFSSYAWTVITNHFIDLNRKRRVQVTNVDWQEIESNDEELAGYARYLAQEDRRLGRIERKEDRLESLAIFKNTLTPEEQRLIVLLARGKSQTEIGYLTNTSQATVSRKIKLIAQKVQWAMGD